MADDRETQSGPTSVPSAARVGAVEPFENSMKVLGGYSGACIRNGEIDTAGGGRCADRDGAARGVPDRIFKQIAQDLLQRGSVCVNAGGTWIDLQSKCDAFRLRDGTDSVHRVAHNRFNVDQHGVWNPATGFDPRQ